MANFVFSFICFEYNIMHYDDEHHVIRIEIVIKYINMDDQGITHAI